MLIQKNKVGNTENLLNSKEKAQDAKKIDSESFNLFSPEQEYKSIRYHHDDTINDEVKNHHTPKHLGGVSCLFDTTHEKEKENEKREKEKQATSARLDELKDKELHSKYSPEEKKTKKQSYFSLYYWFAT